MRTPLLMPELSAGSHRSPRRGACFMEFASYLAGERWSDHPACTDPVLAALARGVNDAVSDARRGELVPLIPRVVGLRGDDETVGAAIALLAASAALPVASMGRQRALAVGVVGLGGHPVLREVPDAARWAECFVAGLRPGQRSAAAPTIVRLAVTGIAEACIPDPDSLLIETLGRAVAAAEAIVKPATASDRVLITA